LGRRQGACRVGRGGVSGEQKRLTAAAAKILRPSVATAAGLRHPSFPAKSAERIGFLPDPFKTTLANVLEFESWDHASCMAGKGFAGGIEPNKTLGPSPPTELLVFCLG